MLSPQMAALIDGILGQKKPVMAPADATARPTAREYGLSDIARRALQKLAEWDTAAGRNVASRLPEGVSLQQGAVPDWIGGPKGVAGGLKRATPFDAEHALAMGKIRAAENAPHAAPDLLPAMAREGREMQPGTIRVFRGVKSAVPRESSPLKDAGRWFTTDIETARMYGDDVLALDLTPEEFARLRQAEADAARETGGGSWMQSRLLVDPEMTVKAYPFIAKKGR